MQFIYNRFPDDPEFEPGGKWVPLKESANLWVIQLQALPFMIVNLLTIILLLWAIGISFELDPLLILLSFVIFAPVHEFIHALFFPESILSKNIYFGFTTKGFVPFAAYIGEMKRNTFIRSLLAPFVIITILGFACLLLLGSNSLIEHIIVFNALGACADCLGVYLLLRQVPRNAIVRNKLIRTYWKTEENALSLKS